MLQAQTKIDEPSFNRVWHLLDVANMLADREQCEPALAFNLAEELLESQTIVGCRIIFDYLESRRERMTKKSWRPKHQVVLRTCNELLRRFSRADNSVFCGRVFIFLFQSFPLGDRSSVNLRGDYHTANKTVWDKTAKPTQDIEKMDTDEPEVTTQIMITPADSSPEQKPSTVIEVKKDIEDKPLDLDTLYPIFWSLQDYFSDPKSLFDSANMKSFKEGLDATLLKFRQVQKDVDVRSSAKQSDEIKQGTKRKWENDDSTRTRTFNPKYLTSRDLFELEISDLSFRRHILVQALILLEFLLFQTPKGRAKQYLPIPNPAKPGETMKPNANAAYSFELPEDEAAWANKKKGEIASYLQHGTEGKFYYRMVDTVLSRDKNWVFWKAHNCIDFVLPSMKPEDFVLAETAAVELSKPKRLRATPMGAFDISFLNDPDGSKMLSKLQDPNRAAYPPALDTFEAKLSDNQFDLDMAKDEMEKETLQDQRTSQKWRTLRIARRDRFALFDKVEDGEKIEILFRGPEKVDEEEKIDEEKENGITSKDEEGKDASPADTKMEDEPSSTTAQQEDQPMENGNSENPEHATVDTNMDDDTAQSENPATSLDEGEMPSDTPSRGSVATPNEAETAPTETSTS
jgi:THO complex subunit 1